jgi:hypothetical protein
MNDPKHMAYHEAGHAVIALRLGYEVGKVKINPKRGSGSAQIRNRMSPDDIRIDLAAAVDALVARNAIDLCILTNHTPTDRRSPCQALRE